MVVAVVVGGMTVDPPGGVSTLTIAAMSVERRVTMLMTAHADVVGVHAAVLGNNFESTLHPILN